jgi:hypothetical protein
MVPEKLTVAYLGKTFPIICGTLRFIYVLEIAHHWNLS